MRTFFSIIFIPFINLIINIKIRFTIFLTITFTIYNKITISNKFIVNAVEDKHIRRLNDL